MDNLIPAMLTIAKKEVREKFKKPDKDKNTGLYIVPSENQNKGLNAFVAKN